MKIGIVFGCFIPLHKGHNYMIQEALSENDKVLLGICGFDDDRGKDFLPFKIRQNLIKDKFAENNKVILSVVDDKKIGLTGKFDEISWKIWGDELFSGTHLNPNDENTYTWYTGEDFYIEKLKCVYPNHKFTLLDRNLLDISGTKIRNDLENNKKYIDKIFLDYLEKNYEKI